MEQVNRPLSQRLGQALAKVNADPKLRNHVIAEYRRVVSGEITEQQMDSTVQFLLSNFSVDKPSKAAMQLKAVRRQLITEPYDPDARDGDNDGIVQEGTAWERPAGTRILDVLGREIQRGRQAGKRPLGVRVVDRDGNDVDYKPTYEGGKPGTIGSTVQRITPTVKPPEEPAVPTPAKKAAAKKAPKPKRESPLADHGARSLRERGLPSAREQYRAATTPPQSEVPEPNEPNEVEQPSARPGFLPDEIPKGAITLYHGTKANPKTIEDEGLKFNVVGEGILPEGALEPDKGGVYLTRHIDEALDYANTPDQVFAVLVSEDEVDGYDPSTGHSFVKNSIPSSRLRQVTDIEKEKRRMEREQRELAARKRPANWTPPTIDDVDTPDALETFAPDGVLYRFETSDRPDDVRPHVYYFSPDPDYASNYGDRGEVVSELPADFLDIRNPKDRAEMKKAVEESLQSLDKLIESKDPEQQAKYRRARRDVEIALEREDSEQALGQQMAALTLAANAVISPDKPLTPGTGQRMILENLKRDALIDIEGADIEGKGKYSMAFKRRPNTTKYELPKRERPEETPVFGDIALFPGVTSDSADRPELVKPERPRSPFKPSPPPLSGRAQELADEAEGDFETFMELLDKEGYVVFDYETTGLQDGNIPVQIGAVRIKDGKIVERFNVFTNPQRPLSDWSKENLKDRDGNPLTDEWLAGQTDLAEAHRQLAEFMGDSIIVAHNLPYDGEIIDRMMKDAGIDHKPSGSIDTLMLLRSAVPKGDGETGPERHTLGSLAEFFDVDLGDAAHTADADSEAAALVLQRAMKWAKDNDSDPEIFDAEKQKELFDAATKKYNVDRKKYEEDLKQYQADLADYERAVVKADEPEAELPQPKTRSRNTTYKRNVPYRKESYKETNEPNENGILQEGTIWERPEGTEFVDSNGRPIRMFQNRTKRQFLVDRSTGEPVDYVPTYERPDFVSPADLIERRPLKEGDHPVMEFYEPGKSVKPEVVEGQLQETRAFRVEQINKRLDRLTDEELDKALKIYKVSDRAALVDKLLDLGDDRVIADIDAIRAKPLYVAMPPSGLKAFLKSKRFKSQFEKPKAKRNAARPTRGGYFNPERRRGIEEELLGIPAGLPDELRPAYGFQMTQHEEDASMLPTTGFAADGYGAVVLRLKDSVRSRTTMSHGDSSDYRIPVIPVDGDVQRDAQIAAVGLGNNAGDLEVLRELASAVDRDPDEFTRGMFGGSPSYSEIQIHGGFSLDDVEEVHFYLGDYSESGQIIQGENGRGYVYVNEERVGSPNKIREDIVKALEQAGLPYMEDKK